MKPFRWRAQHLHPLPFQHRPAAAVLFQPLSLQFSPLCSSRTFSCSPSPRSNSSNSTSTAAPETSIEPQQLSPRWLSDLKARLGRCIQFGLSPAQVHEAGMVLGVLARDWRELVAGSEGFLTGKGRAGLVGRDVIWGEMDAMGHVNNVMYVRYSESGRVRWFQNFASYLDPQNRHLWEELWTPRGFGLILKSIKIDYKFPMGFPDKITVLHKLRSAPDPKQDNFILDVVILSERHQRPAARTEEDILVYDYKKGKKTSIPPYMATQFEQTFKLQEEAKRKYRDRIQNLMERTRQLEKDSWDRPDAKEDVGSAAATDTGPHARLDGAVGLEALQ